METWLTVVQVDIFQVQVHKKTDQVRLSQSQRLLYLLWHHLDQYFTGVVYEYRF